MEYHGQHHRKNTKTIVNFKLVELNPSDMIKSEIILYRITNVITSEVYKMKTILQAKLKKNHSKCSHREK